MNAFLRCPGCAQVVRHTGDQCPSCRRPFGPFDAHLSPQGWTILTLLETGPLSSSTIAQRVGQLVEGISLELELEQLEKRGLVIWCTADPDGQAVCWLTELGRDVLQGKATTLASSSVPAPAGNTARPVGLPGSGLMARIQEVSQRCWPARRPRLTPTVQAQAQPEPRSSGFGFAARMPISV